MSERNAAPKSGATARGHITPDVDHGITIEVAPADPALPPSIATLLHRALCLCGFMSDGFASRRQATRAGNAHIRHAQPRLAIWQTEPCPSWCKFRTIGGHADATVKENRWHESRWFTMDRSRLTAVPDGHRWRLRRTGIQLEMSAAPNLVAPQEFIRIVTENNEGWFDTVTKQPVKFDGSPWFRVSGDLDLAGHAASRAVA